MSCVCNVDICSVFLCDDTIPGAVKTAMLMHGLPFFPVYILFAPPLVIPLNVLIAHRAKMVFFCCFFSMEEQRELWPPGFTACIPLTVSFHRFPLNTSGARIYG